MYPVGEAPEESPDTPAVETEIADKDLLKPDGVEEPTAEEGEGGSHIWHSFKHPQQQINVFSHSIVFSNCMHLYSYVLILSNPIIFPHY